MSWSVQRSSEKRVVVTFEGHLSSADGERSAQDFVTAMGTHDCDVEWDVRGMTGYDSGARKAWQRRLLPVRRQIRSITLVGGSALVRMGASAIALVLGIRCHFAAIPSVP
jgi:hypothetical protein